VDDHVDVKAALELGDYQALKVTKKRVRQYALAALLTEERELQKETRTVDEIKARMAEMKKPGVFAQTVKAKAAELEQESNTHFLGDLPTEHVEDFRDIKEEFDPRESVNGILHVERRSFHEGTDDEFDKADPNDFQAFMELLLSFQPSKQGLSYSLCAESPFRTKEEKAVVYKYIGGLRQHKAGQKHTPYGEWSARMEFAAEEGKAASDKKPYKCPYGYGLEFD
jgi:hypothetical protein